MRKDIAAARDQGAHGVVLGLLLQDGQIDVERTRALVDLARPMEVTFHRAIDKAPQIEEALERVIDTGVQRVLTSGGAPTATEGIEALAALVARADLRIGVMVCGTVRKENVGEIIRRTRASEYHALLRKDVRGLRDAMEAASAD